jgi:Flp pilus assembly pilin Flp
MRNLFSRFERALSGMPAVLIGVAASLTSVAIIVGVKSIDSGAPFN